jgi:hypothetical protein
MATGVQSSLRPHSIPFSTTRENELRLHANTARFFYGAPTEKYLGRVTVLVSDIQRENNPCGFLGIFKKFAKEQTGKDTSFVRCFSVPGSKNAHLLVNFPGKRPFFFPSVSSAWIERRFYNDHSSSTSSSLDFQQTNGKRHSVLVSPGQETLSEISKDPFEEGRLHFKNLVSKFS